MRYLCGDITGAIVDRYLYTDAVDPGAKGHAKTFPTFCVGGTECLMITRADAVCWMVYCHGNAVTLHDLFNSGVAHAIADTCKCNFVAPAYPGKRSLGQAHDKAVVDAALVAYERLCEDSPLPVYLAGRSLGVGVVLGVCACARHQPAGLLMLSGFSSVRNMTQWSLLRCIIADRYNNAAALALKDVSSVPKLIVHGTDDVLVPMEHALALDAAGSNVNLHIIEGMGHSPDVHWPEVYNLFRQFTACNTQKYTDPPVYPAWC